MGRGAQVVVMRVEQRHHALTGLATHQHLEELDRQGPLMRFGRAEGGHDALDAAAAVMHGQVVGQRARRVLDVLIQCPAQHLQGGIVAERGRRGSRPRDPEGTRFLVYLVAVAAFGDAMYGEALRANAGIDTEAAKRFQRWFARLIDARPPSGGC